MLMFIELTLETKNFIRGSSVHSCREKKLYTSKIIHDENKLDFQPKTFSHNRYSYDKQVRATYALKLNFAKKIRQQMVHIS